MSELLNIYSEANIQLGYSDADWTILKDKLKVYLRGKPGKTPTADARRVDTAFDDDAVWRQITSDLRLVELPE